MTATPYAEFLATKKCAPGPSEPSPLGPSLAEFRAIHEIDGPTHYIYGLHDPRTGELRYIGKSDDPRRRLANQLLEKKSTYRCNWVQQLVALGLKPVQVIIDAVPAGCGWEAIEKAYIAAGREAGHQLTNQRHGGEGPPPNMSTDSRARMRATWIGRKHRPESLEKIGAASRGRKHTDEWRAYMRERMRDREFSDEHRRNLRLSQQKFNITQVQEIRALLAQGVSQYVIADRFGTHQGTVSNIARGVTYRDVPTIDLPPARDETGQLDLFAGTEWAE